MTYQWDDVLETLSDQAEEQGYLTYQDVIMALDEDPAPDKLTSLLDVLADREIDVRQQPLEDPDLTDPAEADMDHMPTDDSIALYFRQMAREPLLTREEEVALAKQIEAGFRASQILDDSDVMVTDARQQELEQLAWQGQAAREKLGRANTRLVISIAKRYMGRGLPFSDLIQEGNIGLMRAVDKFDYRRGNRFSTYATWWIRQGIGRALAKKSRVIRIPLHVNDEIRRLYKQASHLEQQLGRWPTEGELAEAMKLSPEAVKQILAASQTTLSLEKPVGEESDTELGNFIPDTEAPDPGEEADRQLLIEQIEEALLTLPPRQAHILRLRFGLGDSGPLTLEAIASQFGLSRERIRQLEKTALRQLRHPTIASRLRSYLA